VPASRKTEAARDTNLLQGRCVIVTQRRVLQPRLGIMSAESPIAIVANILVIAGLGIYGFTLFGEYLAAGRWAKNVTGLFAGIGMLVLAAALILTPENARIIVRVASTRASNVLVWISTGLLLAAIAAFGIITYSKPLRLWHQRKIQRDLHRELPKIP
jgi:hypothetical protein